MPVTMKDIARDLGVSVVTVSKVLRDHSDISAETRKGVLKRVKELNYQPNPAARALVTGRTNLIGLIVPDLVHPFFAQVAKGISARLRTNGYSLIIASSDDDPALERRELDQMQARRVDAVILASTQTSAEYFQQLNGRQIPIILLDRRIPGLVTDFVGINDVMAGTLATRHLLKIGCRTVAHLAGTDVSTSLDRRRGYLRELARQKVKVPPAYLVKSGHLDAFGDSAGYDGMKSLLRLNPRPDGVFCCNDPIAMGAMRAILEAGLRIPEDIALVGCGNLYYADFLRVPLTSVDQDSNGLGVNAAKLALSLAKQKGYAPLKSVLLQAKLVVRASTQKQR